MSNSFIAPNFNKSSRQLKMAGWRTPNRSYRTLAVVITKIIASELFNSNLFTQNTWTKVSRPQNPLNEFKCTIITYLLSTGLFMHNFFLQLRQISTHSPITRLKKKQIFYLYRDEIVINICRYGGPFLPLDNLFSVPFSQLVLSKGRERLLYRLAATLENQGGSNFSCCERFSTRTRTEH